MRTHPTSWYTHLAGWKAVMENALGHECAFLVATTEDGAWRGILPLVHVKSRLFGHYLISLPFLNSGGPVGDDDALVALVEAAVQEAVSSDADLLELRTRHAVATDGLRRSERKITVVLELPRNADELLRGFSQKLRSNIKKPLRERAELRFGPDQVDAFYEVYARNMRDLGTPVLPRGFFQHIAFAFPESVVFAVLFLKGVPICAQCSFQWRDTLEMVWGSSLREYNRFKPTSYMHWAFMELALSKGLRTFDFGRCTPGSGTHRFKSQWGGRDLPLPWLQWPPNVAGSPPSPDRPVYRMAAAVWSRLPYLLTNRLGPPLARLLP